MDSPHGKVNQWKEERTPITREPSIFSPTPTNDIDKDNGIANHSGLTRSCSPPFQRGGVIQKNSGKALTPKANMLGTSNHSTPQQNTIPSGMQSLVMEIENSGRGKFSDDSTVSRLVDNSLDADIEALRATGASSSGNRLESFRSGTTMENLVGSLLPIEEDSGSSTGMNAFYGNKRYSSKGTSDERYQNSLVSPSKVGYFANSGSHRGVGGSDDNRSFSGASRIYPEERYSSSGRPRNENMMSDSNKQQLSQFSFNDIEKFSQLTPQSRNNCRKEMNDSMVVNFLNISNYREQVHDSTVDNSHNMETFGDSNASNTYQKFSSIMSNDSMGGGNTAAEQNSINLMDQFLMKNPSVLSLALNNNDVLNLLVSLYNIKDEQFLARLFDTNNTSDFVFNNNQHDLASETSNHFNQQGTSSAQARNDANNNMVDDNSLRQLLSMVTNQRSPQDQPPRAEMDLLWKHLSRDNRNDSVPNANRVSSAGNNQYGQRFTSSSSNAMNSQPTCGFNRMSVDDNKRNGEQSGHNADVTHLAALYRSIFKPVENEIEKQAYLYRNSATEVKKGEDILTWEGVLPPRNFRNGTFSKKVFLGGVPWEASNNDLQAAFNKFGKFDILWPTKDAQPSPGSAKASKSKGGYCYLIFDEEESVRLLLEQCHLQDGCKRYIYLGSSGKQVQVIPWVANDSTHTFNPNHKAEPGCTVFVGALHGMITAEALCKIMSECFGDVVSAALDTDKHKYPIGSGRVVFACRESFIAAVTHNYIRVVTQKFTKVIQIDPYLEDSACRNCFYQPGIYFCRSFECFRYFCPNCWQLWHSKTELVNHKPLRRSFKTVTNVSGNCAQ